MYFRQNHNIPAGIFCNHAVYVSIIPFAWKNLLNTPKREVSGHVRPVKVGHFLVSGWISVNHCSK